MVMDDPEMNLQGQWRENSGIVFWSAMALDDRYC